MKHRVQGFVAGVVVSVAAVVLGGVVNNQPSPSITHPACVEILKYHEAGTHLYDAANFFCEQEYPSAP